MSYWSAKADLEFMREFQADVEAMWAKEDEYKNWQPPTFRYLGERPDARDDATYQKVRAQIAGGMNRAEGTAKRLRVGHSLSNLLWEGRYQPPRQGVRDAINRTVGAAEDEVRVERRHVMNPAWWTLQVLTFILRLPLMVAGMMGADREKLEKEVWPRVLSAVLSTVLIAVLFAWLGLRQAP